MINHLGVEADSSEQVYDDIARLPARGHVHRSGDRLDVLKGAVSRADRTAT
jgi:hypothetical protein